MGDLGFGGSYSSDDDEEYVIEKIVDERGTGKKKEYLVKFKDYGDEDNTWTTTEDVSPELVKEYENKKKSQQNGDDDDEEFVIEKIVDERGTGKKKEYLVKFKDYGDDDNTWTSKDDVSSELIKEYENKKKKDSQPEQNGDEYEIEKIVEDRTMGKKKEYYVKWKNSVKNTWEPKEKLSLENIEAYEAKKGIKHEHKKEEEYTIEKILEDRIVGKKGEKKKEYLVKWKDWIISTWEPEEYLSSEVPDIVQEYESKNKKKTPIVKKQTPKKPEKTPVAKKGKPL